MDIEITRGISEWCLDKQFFEVAKAFEDGFLFQDDKHKKKFQLQKSLAKCTGHVGKCCFDQIDTLKNILKAIDELEITISSSEHGNLYETAFSSLKRKLIILAGLTRLKAHAKLEVHGSEFLIPTDFSISYFNYDTWMRELHEFYENEPTFAECNITSDEWDLVIDSLTENLLLSKDNGKTYYVADLKIIDLYENNRMSHCKMMVKDLLKQIKQANYNPYLVFDTPRKRRIVDEEDAVPLKQNLELKAVKNEDCDSSSNEGNRESDSSSECDIKKEKAVAPLGKRFVPGSLRQDNSFWSQNEIEALMKGYEKYGRRWCHIIDDKELHKVLFDKHNMQCKDKYDNMTKKRETQPRERTSKRLIISLV